MRTPEAIERPLPWGPVLRGLRWRGGQDTALLLHEPGADVDAWAALPGRLSRLIEIETIALDLPGHGLSDDPWEPERLPDLVQVLAGTWLSAGRRSIIVAGSIALATLLLAGDLGLASLVCLSPEKPREGFTPPRSPRGPKLIVAGSLAGEDLDTARQLASTCGGWTVVTSLPVADRGTGLLASPWRDRLIEEIVAFLRDCQRRPVRPGAPTPLQRAGLADPV